MSSYIVALLTASKAIYKSYLSNLFAIRCLYQRFIDVSKTALRIVGAASKAVLLALLVCAADPSTIYYASILYAKTVSYYSETLAKTTLRSLEFTAASFIVQRYLIS
jgi:hypothetical protein